MMIEKLQYITQETEELTHIDCVREACIGGVKWVQLRVKDKSDEEYLSIAKEAKIICDLYDVILVINDNVAIASEVNSHGVHLGITDMYISEARSILGEDAIIGGTANTLKDIERLIEHKADYICLGPFGNADAKQSSVPVLGLEGYEKILEDLKTFYSLEEIPIIASGGIDIYDVDPLLNLGVFGIAVSEMITNDFSTASGLMKTIERKSFKLETLSKL